MDHQCLHEADISEIKTKVIQLENILTKGNGVYKSVIQLTENVAEHDRILKAQTSNIDRLAKTVESLVYYKVKTEAEEEAIIKLRKERDAALKQRRWLIGVTIGAMVTVLVSFLDKLL